jgi:hypothetical protein
VPPKEETQEDKLPGYSTSQILENTDVILQYIQSHPEMNCLGARALKFIPEKDRWSVRVHYTGKLLLLTPKCLKVAASPDLRQIERDTGVEKSKMYQAAMGLIKKNLNLRRNISNFVQQGVKNKGGPGALVINLVDADSPIPKFIDNPEALFSPKQICFLSVDELEKKFGRAFTHGRGELKERFEPGMEWPDLVKTNALFVKNQVFAGWNASVMAPPGTDPETLKRAQDFYETYGIPQQHATAVLKFHFARRCAGEQPPFAPQNPHEHYVMSVMKSLGAYDGMGNVMAQAFGEVGAKNIHPIGDAPLWSDHEEMDGYRNSMGCSIFCFLPVPVAATITNDMNDTVYGWRVIGFDTLTLWLPDMERRMRAAKTEEEKLKVFENDFEDDVFDA